MATADNEGTAPLLSEATDGLGMSDADAKFVDLARGAFQTSDDWFTTSIRKDVERALSNFRNQHPAGSKYHSAFYDKRSRLFRPKTRSMVRTTEAAAAVAFFSTADAILCTPFNDGDPRQRLAADIHSTLLNYRLEDPEHHWFLTVLGAVQDAATTGVCISRQTWDYKTKEIETANGPETVVKRDRPRVDLVPIENLRISPTADWRDPIGTSPYVIELIPMYAYEIRDMARTPDLWGRPQYRPVHESLLTWASKQDWDSIRRVRSGEKRLDVFDHRQIVGDYHTLWVHRNIVHYDGRDWVYDTLGTEIMLSTEARPIEDVYPHGRPYAMGFMVLEAHRIYASSPAMIVEGLQEQSNDLVNLRIDNVRLALGKRWVVKRGAGVDTRSLMRNVASSVTMSNDPDRDIRELVVNDVTGSSYQEQDRLNLDFDEIAGKFSTASVASNRKLNETVGGMQLLAGDANQIQEYQVRMVAETWMEVVIRQLVKMESIYETDEQILAAVGAAHGITAEQAMIAMQHPIKVKLSVGFNATNPEKRIQKLALGLSTMATYFPQVVQSGNSKEIAKEIFGALGFKDASRFLPMLNEDGEDPRVAALQQQLAELQQMLQGKVLESQTRVQVAQIGAEATVAVARMRAEIELMKAEAGNNLEMFLVQMKNRLEEIDRAIAVEDADIRRRELYLQREALSHSILEADRNFQLKLRQVNQKAAESKGNGAADLKGDDKAGTISRGNFGSIPGMGG